MFILAMSSLSSLAQVIHLPPAVSQGPGMDNVPIQRGDKVQQQQALAAAKQRLAEVKRDTDKLLQLSNELKAYVDQTDQTVMSADTLKKAEEVEKLAKSIRKKINQLY